MTFNVEVLLKGREDVVETEIDFEGPEPAAWADDDVRRVLELTLGAFDQVQNPDADEHLVALRGFSWIVTPVDGGVAVAIEINHRPIRRRRAGRTGAVALAIR